MKKLKLITLFLILMSRCAMAQNRIDNKLKKPNLNRSTSTVAARVPFNKDLLVRMYGKSQSEKLLDRCQKEYDAFNQNGDEIWIYTDEFFNGEKKILKVGDYTLLGSATTHELGMNWNDKISSMLIPNSLKITIFLDDKFKGLSTSTAGYGVTNMESGAVGFKGDYYTFKSAGKYSKGGLYFVGNAESYNANDNISSLKIYKVY